MTAHRKLTKKALYCTCIIVVVLNVCVEARSADSIFWNVEEPNSAQPRLLLAQQMRRNTPPTTVVPTIPTPMPQVPSIDTLSPSLGLSPLPQLSPSPNLSPITPSPGIRAPGAGGGLSTGPGVNSVQIVPPCMVTTAGGWPSANCPYRFIHFEDLYNDFYSCSSGACYARKFLELDRTPIVVIYPFSSASRATAQAQLHAVMASGIRAMGAQLGQRASNGAAGLPSISQIRSLVDNALAAIYAIDLPVNESRDERLRRLGLTQAIRSLATQAQ